MREQDLSRDIKTFAAEHEAEIKRAVLKEIEEFFDSTISDNYHEKWDAGMREHGPMTEETLNGMNWTQQMTMEFKDAFWYETLIRFRLARGKQN